MVVLVATISVSCAIRLWLGRHPSTRPVGAPDRHEDIGHLVMGMGMIVMLSSWMTVLPKPVWLALFLCQALGTLVLLLGHSPAPEPPSPRPDHWPHVNHLMGSAAMAYMVVAMVPAHGAETTGHAMLALPSLAMPFALYFVAATLGSGVRLVTLRAATDDGGGLPTVICRPRLVEACRAAMGLVMAYMLWLAM